MLTFLRDLRYALRTLRKMPSFTIVAVLVLALGIGANTAIFSVVNSVLLRPLPFPGADRLALIWETDLKDGIKREGPSAPNFLDWKEQSQSFEDMELLEVGTGTVTGDSEPEQVDGLRVTTNFLSMLGARTVLGRTFTAAEGAGKARFPVAVLTNGFWKRRFGADPRVIGRTFIMNSEPYTVIGVLTPDFWQPLPCDLYVPWPVAELRAKERVAHDFGVIARLKPGLTIGQAQAELSAIARRIDAQTPRLAGWDVDRSWDETGTLRVPSARGAGTSGGSRASTAAGLRDRRESLAWARHGPAQGNGDSCGIGRGARPPHGAHSRRESAAEPHGRRAFRDGSRRSASPGTPEWLAQPSRCGSPGHGTDRNGRRTGR